MDVKKRIVLITLLIFAISLYFTAFKVEDMGEIKEYKSFLIFLLGPIIFLGGALFEFLIWTANIWFFISIICIYNKWHKLSFIFGLITLFAVSFSLFKEVLASENGRMAQIYSLELGYFLWIISILFLTLSSVYFIIKPELNKN